MKQKLKFFTVLGLIILFICLTAENFRQGYQVQRQLSDKQNELTQLKTTFENQQSSSNFTVSIDHNENLQILATKYLTISKTRTEKNSEKTDLFFEFNGDFKKSLFFINDYLQNDFQYVLKQIKMSALNKNNISLEINFGDDF